MLDFVRVLGIGMVRACSRVALARCRGNERYQVKLSQYEKEQRAFDYMVALIQQGVEFPDAQYKAATLFGVSQDVLQAMYDGEQA